MSQAITARIVVDEMLAVVTVDEAAGGTVRIETAGPAGPPGPEGPPGPIGSEPDLPDLSLLFANKLV